VDTPDGHYHAPVSPIGRPSRPAGVPAWDEAAEDWLAAKRVGRPKDDAGHSDRARRADLRRWAAAINAVQGRSRCAPAQMVLSPDRTARPFIFDLGRMLGGCRASQWGVMSRSNSSWKRA
jgi:hypothetical protein